MTSNAVNTQKYECKISLWRKLFLSKWNLGIVMFNHFSMMKTERKEWIVNVYVTLRYKTLVSSVECCVSFCEWILQFAFSPCHKSLLLDFSKKEEEPWMLIWFENILHLYYYALLRAAAEVKKCLWNLLGIELWRGSTPGLLTKKM